MTTAAEMTTLWNRYVEGKRDIVEEVSPQILHSWKRSIDNQVNPYQIDKNDILDQSQLKYLQGLNGDLLAAAREVMEDLFICLKGNGVTVVLTDMQGYILEAYTEDSFFQLAQKIALAPGANWSEGIKGTNAIGMALVESRSVHIMAQEHYCQENHFLSCSATPIMGSGQQILGILDITGDYRIVTEKMIAMARMAAKSIENRLVLNRVQRDLAFSRHEKEGMLEIIEQALISFDVDGKIIDINPSGARVLGLRPEQCIGQPLDQLVDVHKSWMLGADQSSGVFTVKTHEGSALMQAQTKKFYDQDGNVLRVMAAFKKADNQRMLTNGLTTRFSFDQIVTNCPDFRKVIDNCKRIARSHTPVLLLGETGTGKEMFAQSIHQASSRGSGPFVVVNCAALPDELIESELFGHDEGAFTGAKRGGYPGKFELAHGGTIFLDEVGELPLLAQAKILRVLQERQVMRLGSNKVISVDIRVVSATNQNLAEMVERGTFRRDLFYRLNVVTVKIPSLRERQGDLELLIDILLNKHTRLAGKPIMQCAPSCLDRLTKYSWPGNVRELENTIEGLVNLVDAPIITMEHLPAQIRNATAPPAVSPLGSMKDAEQIVISQALVANQGNLSQTAKILGIGRTTLYRKIKEYGLEVPR